jgi:uncharacterized damage-inducible protein DinB
MHALELLRELFGHMEWADALVWNAIFSAPASTEDSAIRHRLHHLHLVQRAFLLIWRGQPMDFNFTESLAPDQLAKWGREYHREVAPFLASLAPISLDIEVLLPWASQVTATPNSSLHNPSLGETLIQVTAHSTYHRGQVNARLREVGVEPPLTDFIAWVWYGKPAAAWPSQAQPAPA